jgi:hypothetical protein
MACRDDVRFTRTLFSAALTIALVGLLALAIGARAQEPSASPSPSAAPPPADGSQPIAFSHKVHAAANVVECQLCHSYARRGPVAGIPSVQRCVGCHRVVVPDKPEIVKLMGYAERREPIPWVRIHNLPDFVRFTHKRHVLAGVTCQTCHGEVGQMDAAVQSAPLTMGWCLTCHEERQAPTDCLICHN